MCIPRLKAKNSRSLLIQTDFHYINIHAHGGLNQISLSFVNNMLTDGNDAV